MVAVVSGSGLGLFNSSAAGLGNAGVSGNPNLGQAKEQVYVNSTTGNLVIQHQDDFLTAVGLDVGVISTYNSQGKLDDDNGDNWKIGLYRRVYGLTGALNTAGSTVIKVFGDGAEVTYSYNATLAKYVSTDGDGAHDTLTWNGTNSQWTWTDGSARNTETYDWNSTTGKLLNSKDADGNQITYNYTGTLLTSVVDASGQTTYLDYTGNNLTQIRVVSNGQTQTLTRYYYDNLGRLNQVVVDLTPAVNTIPLQDADVDGYYDTVGGQSYVTHYTYDGTSKRVASITQGDGTTVSFTYQSINGDYRVKSYTDGNGHVTTIDYSQPTGGGSSPAQVTATAGSATYSTAGFQPYSISGTLATVDTVNVPHSMLSNVLTTPPGSGATYQQSNYKDLYGPTTTISAKYDNAQTAGDLNVVFIGWNDATSHINSIQDSKGNSYVLAGLRTAPGFATQAVYYAKNIVSAAAGSNSITVVMDAAVSNLELRIGEYGGIDTTNPLDVIVGANGVGLSMDSGALTTTSANDLLIGANYIASGTTQISSTFEQRLYTDFSQIMADRVASAAGSYNVTASQYGTGDAPSDYWIMQLVAFRPSAASAPYYVVPASATWQSIANAVYGVNSAAAGTVLQTALGNPALTTGAHLTGFPATLIVPTSTVVPPYYVVPTGATWQSIANAV